MSILIKLLLGATGTSLLVFFWALNIELTNYAPALVRWALHGFFGSAVLLLWIVLFYAPRKS